MRARIQAGKVNEALRAEVSRLVRAEFAGKGLFGELSWAEAFLLAAVLTPTDPVVTSTVVTSFSSA